MEIQIRPARERGHYDHGWLDTSHTFSFADYYDPRFMGFRVLRVINEDIVAPGRGFGMHPHHDMEILTYVLEGELGHKDSMGNGSTIKPGELQRMSAGTGITHSEMNASKTKRVHFLQIWMLPDKQGHKPGYEQKAFSEAERRNKLRVVASRDGRDGSITINQDATLSIGLLSPRHTVEHVIAKSRYAWVQVARGAIELNGQRMGQGDGASVRSQGTVTLTAIEDSEVLLFDLP